MKPINANPIISTSVILWYDSQNSDGSVINFNKRQVWNVYPYKKHVSDSEYYGECEYKGFVIRLMPKDFTRIFGEDIIERAKDGD